MQIIHKLQPPFGFGLLGTDQLGHDVLSMLMAGCWNSLSISLSSVAIGGTIGTIIGIATAARRGLFESLVMRACDVIFALPPILSAMILGAFLGTGRLTAIIAIAVFMVPVFARVALGSALQAWSRDYVLAARAIGNTRLSITLRHVLPNIIERDHRAGDDPARSCDPDRGRSCLPWPRACRRLRRPGGGCWRMRRPISRSLPGSRILPGLAIALSVLGFNMLGDGLRDLLDPREASR